MNNLSIFDSEEITSGPCGDAATRWCQSKIQKALCHALGEPQERQTFYSRLEVSAYTELPDMFKRIVSNGSRFNTNFCTGDATGFQLEPQIVLGRYEDPHQSEVKAKCFPKMIIRAPGRPQIKDEKGG